MKQKKQLILLVVLLLLLAALITGYVLLSRYNAAKDPTPEESIPVVAKEETNLTALSYSDGETELSFNCYDGVWEYAADPHFPLQQSALAEMAAAAKTVTARLQLEPAKGETYGLDAPARTVYVAFSDGTELTYLFGDTSDFNGYQYFSVTGDSSIYMVESTYGRNFMSTLTSLYQPETNRLLADGVTAAEVAAITIETEGGTVKEITDAAGVETLLSKVQLLNLSDWIDYYADAEEMQEQYGIYPGCDRVTVTTESGSEYVYYLGIKYSVDEEAADGEDAEPEYFYFYTPAGSTVVYGAPAENVDAIFNYLMYTPISGETEKE